MLKSRTEFIFDRRKLIQKRGVGQIEILVRITSTTRKYIIIGESNKREWLSVTRLKENVAKIELCERILAVMDLRGEDLTIKVFTAYYEEMVQAAIYKPKKKKSVVAESKVELPMKKVIKREPRAMSKNFYNGVDQRSSFITYMRMALDEESVTEGTKRHKKCTIDAVEFSGILNTYADLTYENIMKFDAWLRKDGKMDTTVYGYHKNVKQYVKQLHAMMKIPYNPYDRFKVKRGTHKKRQPLIEEELVALRKMSIKDEKLNRVRDLFIFSAYTGLAYCDLQNFDFEDMTVEVNGMRYIDCNRLKTGSDFYTPILNPAMDVLIRRNFKLPRISNQKGNDYLHLIEAEMHRKGTLAIQKTMTFHIARHSFATLALTHDVPISDVSKMMGHKDIKITMEYAKTLKSVLQRHSIKWNNELM